MLPCHGGDPANPMQCLHRVRCLSQCHVSWTLLELVIYMLVFWNLGNALAVAWMHFVYQCMHRLQVACICMPHACCWGLNWCQDEAEIETYDFIEFFAGTFDSVVIANLFQACGHRTRAFDLERAVAYLSTYMEFINNS